MVLKPRTPTEQVEARYYWQFCFHYCYVVGTTINNFLKEKYLKKKRVNSPKDCFFFSFFSIAPRFISINGENTTEN